MGASWLIASFHSGPLGHRVMCGACEMGLTDSKRDQYVYVRCVLRVPGTSDVREHLKLEQLLIRLRARCLLPYPHPTASLVDQGRGNGSSSCSHNSSLSVNYEYAVTKVARMCTSAWLCLKPTPASLLQTGSELFYTRVLSTTCKLWD